LSQRTAESDTRLTGRRSRTHASQGLRFEKKMNRELTRRLLLYIVDQLQAMEAPISTIRLVKFLYLIDLEYFNRRCEALTGIEWVKYDYGPYFFDLPEVIRSTRLDLEPREVETEHGIGITFRSLEPQEISDIVPFSVQVMINRVLKQWAFEDTPILLEHVYGTLPVKHGDYGQPLDFTYETDHLLLQEARESMEDFVTLEELFEEFGNPLDAT
jgi:hypothetical protein